MHPSSFLQLTGREWSWIAHLQIKPDKEIPSVGAGKKRQISAFCCFQRCEQDSVSPLMGFALVMQGWLYSCSDVCAGEDSNSVGAFQPQFPQNKVCLPLGSVKKKEFRSIRGRNERATVLAKLLFEHCGSPDAFRQPQRAPTWE